MVFQALSKIACNRLQKELLEWQVNPPAGFKQKVTDNLQRYLFFSLSFSLFRDFLLFSWLSALHWEDWQKRENCEDFGSSAYDLDFLTSSCFFFPPFFVVFTKRWNWRIELRQLLVMLWFRFRKLILSFFSSLLFLFRMRLFWSESHLDV